MPLTVIPMRRTHDLPERRSTMMSEQENDESFAQSLQTRRLRLRHSLTSPAQLPSIYNHHRRRSSTSSAVRPKFFALDSDDLDWETEGAQSPVGSEHGHSTALAFPHTKHQSKSSVSSTLSNATTAVNTSDQNQCLHVSNDGDTRSPPSNSSNPLVRELHHRRQRSSDGGRREARYIEHLERQVQELTTRLQGYTEPTVNNSHAAKLRKLSLENRSLRSDLEEWAAKFEQRVKEEAAERIMIDKSQRLRITELETKWEDSEEQCRILRQEVKQLKKQVDEARRIKEENHRLESRIEALSELLTDSARHRGSPPAEVKLHDAILPKRISSLPTTTLTVHETSSHDESRPFYGGLSDFGIPDPVDSAVPTSECGGDRSRSPSVTSCCSRSSMSTPLARLPSHPVVSSIPLPSIADQASVGIKGRRMRRFPSGSSAPKALILPSATAVSATPTAQLHAGFDTRSTTSSILSRPNSSSSMNSGHSQFSSIGISQGVGSLFAELARAEGPCTVDDIDVMSRSSRHSASGSDHPKASSQAPSPISDTFNLITDTLSRPSPMIVRILDGLHSPKQTITSARWWVSRGVNRVTKNRMLAMDRHRRRTIVDSTTCDRCGWTVGSLPAQLPPQPPSALLRKRSPNKSAQVDSSIKDGLSAVEDSLWLWVRFIIAVVVALGVAVKDGPAAVVVGPDDEGIDHVREEERERALRKLEGNARGEFWTED